MGPGGRAQRPDCRRRAGRGGGSRGAPLRELSLHGAKMKVQATGGKGDGEGENEERFHGEV
jgi:hypothetical protein